MLTPPSSTSYGTSASYRSIQVGSSTRVSHSSQELPSLSLLESDPVYAPPGGVVQEYEQAGWKQQGRSPIVCSSISDGLYSNDKPFDSPSGRFCCRWYHRYFFASKAVVLVLLLNALFSTALYGVTSEVLKLIIGPEFVLARNLVIHGVTQILFPVAGHIADSYAGKHNVIRFSLWAGWIGFAVLGVCFSLENFNDHISVFNKYFVLPAIFVFLSVSYIGFTATVIPFGMDQLQGASHIHYRSFFYWWYWTLNVGVIIVNVPQYCQTKVEMGVTIQAEIGIVCISAAIILDALFKHWFVIEPKCPKSNPIKQIVRILKETRTRRRKNHRIPSSVRHELDMRKLSRLDLVKKRYGGKYETEEVEDVRTFFRMLLVLCSVGFPIFSYAGVFGTVGLMASHMDMSLATLRLRTNVCGIEVTITDAINALLILTIIPLLDLLIIPIMRNCYATILKRLGIGAVLAFLSILVLFLFEASGTHINGNQVCVFNPMERDTGQLHISVYWILLPLVMVTFAEIFIYIPSFEFICAQSPYNMRGLLIGLFFSVQGSFSLLSVLIQYIFTWESVYSYPFRGLTGYTCTFWYYLIYVSVCFFGLFLYVLTAARYKRRQRDDVFSDMRMIEEFFHTGAIAHPFQ